MNRTIRTAADIMNEHVHALKADTSAVDAVRWLVDRGYSGAPVVNEAGVLLGVFSEHDAVGALIDAITERHPVGNVDAYMTHEVVQVPATMALPDLSLTFSRGKHRRVLVTNEQRRVLGIVTRRDLVAGLLAELEPGKRPTTYDILRQRWS